MYPMSAAIPASCHSFRRSPPSVSGSARVTPTRSKPASRARSCRMCCASPGCSGFSVRGSLTGPPIVTVGLGAGGARKGVYLLLARMTPSARRIIVAISTVNPATGEEVKTFDELSDEEIERKLQLAADTFLEYRKTSFEERARMMMRAAEILEDEAEGFGQIGSASCRERV